MKGLTLWHILFFFSIFFLILSFNVRLLCLEISYFYIFFFLKGYLGLHVHLVSLKMTRVFSQCFLIYLALIFFSWLFFKMIFLSQSHVASGKLAEWTRGFSRFIFNFLFQFYLWKLVLLGLELFFFSLLLSGLSWVMSKSS